MSSEIRTLGRHAAIYGIGNMLAKLTSFIMLPIYTRFLTPADYGVLELTSMTLDFLAIMMGLNVSASVYRFFAEENSKSGRDLVMSTATMGKIASAVVMASVGLALSPWLAHVVTPEKGHADYFRLFFLIFVMQSAEAVPFLLCRALHRSFLVVTINLARLVALVTLNVVFVVHLGMGVKGILLSNLIVSTVIAVAMLRFLFRSTGYGFSPKLFIEMTRFSLPVGFVSLGNFFLVFSDRYFLNHYAGPAAVGVYALAYRFGFVLTAFVAAPFHQIWAPERFQIAKRPNAGELFRRIFLYFNVGLGCTALIMSLFVRDALKLMSATPFWGAYAVVPLIMIAQILHQWTAYNNFGLLLTKKTKKFAWGSAIAIPSVLLLNFLLIPRYGVWGAAIATIIAYVLRFVVIQALSQREYRIDYDWLQIGKLYAILASGVAIRELFGDLQIVPSLALCVGIAATALAGVYFYVLSGRERDAVQGLLRRRIEWQSLLRSVARPAAPQRPADRKEEVTV
jgi:O-antigen/teichoic acid export membrane protein